MGRLWELEEMVSYYSAKVPRAVASGATRSPARVRLRGRQGDGEMGRWGENFNMRAFNPINNSQLPINYYPLPTFNFC